MENAVELIGITKSEVPVERVLNGASKADLKHCIIVGTTNEDNLYFASSQADGGDILWMMEKAKQLLMEID